MALLSFGSRAWALELPTVTRIEGSAKIFSNPSKTKEGQPPHALFDGMYFSVADAKVKAKLQNGSIIQTGESSKVRLVYPNGDFFTVGPQSAFRVNYQAAQGAKSETKVDLMFGKLRTFIAKDSPRSGMEVRARSAVMGVRGTDFAISAFAGEQGTKLTVLRGAVTMAASPKAKTVEVPAGFSASVATPSEPQKSAEEAVVGQEAVPLVQKTDTLELAKVQQSSAVSKSKDLIPEVEKEIEAIEKKSADATLQDIKKTDPELYAKMVSNKDQIHNIDQLQTTTVKVLYESAPPPPESQKPGWKELGVESSDDIYKKYFTK